MILPNKYIPIQDCIFTSSALILKQIKNKRFTVDKLWEVCDKKYNNTELELSYEKFLLSLIFMYSCDMIKFNEKGEILR